MTNQLLGFEPLTPEIQSKGPRQEARRDATRAELIRDILNRLSHDQAAVITCSDAEELQALRCTVLVYGKRQIATHTHGLTLHIFRKPTQAPLL